MKPRKIFTFNKFLFFSLIFFAFGCLGQSDNNTNKQKIYSVSEVDSIPSFPGGEKKMVEYINQSTRWVPKIDVYGSVYLSFIINENGSISDVKVEKSLCAECDKEAIKVIQGMPYWKPGKIKEDKVRTRVIISVPFKLVD